MIRTRSPLPLYSTPSSRLWWKPLLLPAFHRSILSLLPHCRTRLTSCPGPVLFQKDNKDSQTHSRPHPQPVWASKMELSWRSQCLCTTEEIESKLFYAGQKQYKIKFQWDKWWVPLHQIRMLRLGRHIRESPHCRVGSSKLAAE